ncbi:hypothetical protein OD350_29040 (plasmid) [Clostridium beijerinckii]|uniref:hypothetical protein n=1 Tax=Clostridium beijerinckii TaxID=1520 RepID=UPI0022270250|nr:hypothetical protein [Clostridium beijerinckii]UYZ38935.1 hypothetical protein OD350_29040 [Clostridium beijerinckii]
MKKVLITTLMITFLFTGILPVMAEETIRADVPLYSIKLVNDESSIQTEKCKTTTASAVTIENPNQGDIIQEPTEQQPNNIDNVYHIIIDSLSKIKTTNNTEEQDIIRAIKDVDSSINAKFKENEGSFKKIDATAERQGSITGIVEISNGLTSKEIQVNLTIEKLGQVLLTDKNKVVTLETKIGGNLLVGEKIWVDKVTGYNESNEEVMLNEDYITYKWFADGNEIGNNKELEITSNMVNKIIEIKVDYLEEKGGIEE